MNEPFETLLSQYKDHVVVGKFLQGDTPEWDNIWTQAMPALSGGEKVMFEVALACYNLHGIARVSDLFLLDQDNQERVLDALSLWIRGRK